MTELQATGIDEWSDLCSSSFVPLRAAGDHTFHGSIEHIAVGDIGVARVRCTSSAVRRSAKLIASELRSDILLSVQLGGAGRISQGVAERRSHRAKQPSTRRTASTS